MSDAAELPPYALPLMRQIEPAYGTDAHRTAGKAPVMSDRVMEALRPLADAGLVKMDYSDMPIAHHPHGLVLGAGWVSITDAGRAILAETEAADVLA